MMRVSGLLHDVNVEIGLGYKEGKGSVISGRRSGVLQ